MLILDVVEQCVIPWFLWPLQEVTTLQKKNKKEIQHKDIGAILTFLAKCFYKLKEAYSFCTCTTQGLQ